MTVTYSVTRLLGGGNGSHTQKVYLYPAFVPSSHTPRPLPLQPGGISKQAKNSCLWELSGIDLLSRWLLHRTGKCWLMARGLSSFYRMDLPIELMEHL